MKRQFELHPYLFRTYFEGVKTYKTVKSEELVGAAHVVARNAVKVNGNQQLSRPVFGLEQGYPRGVPLRENKRKQCSFQRNT